MNVSENPDASKLKQYFNFYQQNIYPLVEQYTTQTTSGCHTMDHTSAVVFRGIDLALSIEKNPMPVVFAGAFHDMARTHDGFDINHGKNAVPNAVKIMTDFPYNLTSVDRNMILYAIANHTTGRIAPDYVSACLWDADRIRLSWLYGYKSEFFNTNRAKYIASHPAPDYIKFQTKCFPKLFWSHEY